MDISEEQPVVQQDLTIAQAVVGRSSSFLTAKSKAGRGLVVAASKADLVSKDKLREKMKDVAAIVDETVVEG